MIGSVGMKENFVFESNGTKYACQQTNTGIGVQTQTVEVLGIGMRADPARYGSGHQPTSTMRKVATVIAGNILSRKD
jgi:hypothetical protein